MERGKKTNKDRLFEQVEKRARGEAQGVDASHLAQSLGIPRNLASSLLNELAAEGKIRKKKTRPVLFYCDCREEDQEEEDPFREFIGFDKSLREQMEKCRLAANYPNRGMPVMILGPSGVGKSLMAEYIFRYAKFKKLIPEDALFVVLNCADYANNQELLSSILFGYKKGAFTGAAETTEGLFQKADKGYLFLDEFHRLPPEGQEKLFRYIDKGVVAKIGDSSSESRVDVRLIFATTEDISSMLDTFIRRVPVMIEIPPFAERTIEERFQIICRLFFQEAQTMGCGFLVSSNVVNQLLMLDLKGNIGSIKNAVKLSCASAFCREKAEPVRVKIRDLSDHYRFERGKTQIQYIPEAVLIDKEWSPKKGSGPKGGKIRNNLDWTELCRLLGRYQNHGMTQERFRSKIYRMLEKFTGSVMELTSDEMSEAIYQGAIKKILGYLQENYGLQYNGTMLTVLSRILLLFSRDDGFSEEDVEELRKIEELIRSQLYRCYKMSAIFYEMARQTIDYEACPQMIRVFTALYFYCRMDVQNDLSNAVIVAHGHATASSIASMANRMFGQYIFEAFDMPFDISKKEVVKKIRNYLKRVDTSRGLLLFVDTGSLLDIAEDIQNDVEGDLGIINNITTQMAVEAGERILKREGIQFVVEQVVKHNVTNFTYIKQRRKADAVVVCCITGIGTALKIRDMLREGFRETEVEIEACEYQELASEKLQCEVFHKYNVLFIISTIELNLSEKPVLLLNDLVTEKGKALIEDGLRGKYTERVIRQVMTNIIKGFSMRNIIGQLTILNPDKIIVDVEEAVEKIEDFSRSAFSVDLKKMLYIHISIMVERLILEKGRLPLEDGSQFAKCHSEFILNSKNSFSVIESKYNVSVNQKELKLIYELITGKSGGPA